KLTIVSYCLYPARDSRGPSAGVVGPGGAAPIGAVPSPPGPAMPAGSSAFLVVRRDDGFGDVFPIAAGQTYTLGRATTNRIVLKDALCSREHAEVSHGDGRWRVRDLNSLNGTRVNNEALDSEWELAPRDVIHLGRTDLVFVEAMHQLPDPPPPAGGGDGVSIKKRLGQTRFLTPVPPVPPGDGDEAARTVPIGSQRHALSRHLSLLYRPALDMGSA